MSSLLSHAIIETPKHNSAIDDAVEQLFTYVATLAQSNDAGLQDIAMQEYSSVLQSDKARKTFWTKRQQTLKPLFDILQAAVGGNDFDSSTLRSGMGSIRSNADSLMGVGGGVGLQLLYHVLLVIWQLSFQGRAVGKSLDE